MHGKVSMVSNRNCFSKMRHTTNRKYHIAYLFVPFPMTSKNAEGHLPNAGLIESNLKNICATFSTVLTDPVRHVVPLQ